MHTLFAVVLTAIVTFAATNIDDIFVLILFFSQTDATFRPRHVVIGQYLGFVVLLLLSILGFVTALIVPDYVIGLLGLAPITLGVRRLLRLRRDGQDEEKSSDLHAAPRRRIGFLPPQTLAVAGVTIANGGDNLGTYIPLFAAQSLTGVLIFVAIFLLLVAVWCIVAYRLIRQPTIGALLKRYGARVVPFVLIGLGIYILYTSGTIAWVLRR